MLVIDEDGRLLDGDYVLYILDCSLRGGTNLPAIV
jgi:hypothetical protein